MTSGSLWHAHTGRKIDAAFFGNLKKPGRQHEAGVLRLAARDVAQRGLTAAQLSGDLFLPHASPLERGHHGSPIDSCVCHAASLSNKRSESKRENSIAFPYAQRMSSDFGRRLKQAREAAGLTQEELCRRVGMAQSTLASAESRGEGSRKTPQLAHELKVNPHWLATGEGAMRIESGITLDSLTKQLNAYTVPPTRTVEEIVAGVNLGDEFRHALADDALAPEHPAGTDMVWSTSKQPKIGSVVLVVDAHNQLHARRYAQGRMPGQWLANAVHPAYASFDSQADGLRVVAVAKYREML